MEKTNGGETSEAEASDRKRAPDELSNEENFYDLKELCPMDEGRGYEVFEFPHQTSAMFRTTAFSQEKIKTEKWTCSLSCARQIVFCIDLSYFFFLFLTISLSLSLSPLFHASVPF